MAQATGVFKQVAYKKQSALGTAAGTSGGKLLRRTAVDIALTKQTYESAEIRPDQQVADFRHGVRSAGGTINGELSPGSYADWLAAGLRRDFAAVTPGASMTLTVAASGAFYTLTRSAGSFLTDGIKRGDVIRLSAAGSNTAKNLLVVTVIALVATVKVLNGSTLTVEGPTAGVVATVHGKKTFAPTSGHTNDAMTVEQWHADIAQSELFIDVQPTKIDINLPATGLATISIPVVGKDIVTATSQYFSTPTALGTTGITAAVNGVIVLGGVAVAIVTGLTMSIDSPRNGDPVVGSNTIPTRFPGRIRVSGQATAYFEDATLRDAFINETEVELIVVLTSDNSATSNFVAFTLPRVKLGGATKNDVEGGIVQTLPYQALLPATGGAGIANELSTIVVQDSSA